MYYEINEQTAQAAHDAVHMSSYKTGSATAEYRAAVDEVAALVEKKKSQVSEFYHDKLDHLLDSYSRRLAEWHNSYNRNAASCPSWFIAGASNYPMRKHEKQMSREGKLWEEYKEIEHIIDKIKGIGTGPVDLADPHAREILTDQLNRAQSDLDRAKRLNAYYRKNKTFTGSPDLSLEAAEKWNAEFAENLLKCPWADKPFPDYELTSIRGKIKRITARLAELDKREAAADIPIKAEEVNGVKIVRNIEIDRLQIIFDDIPPAETRAALKSNGFRWSPSNKAWQRQLTDNAERAARKVLGM